MSAPDPAGRPAPKTRLFPAPGEAVPEWHVSPLVDVIAYHLSWLWILVPLLIVGGEKPTDYLLLWTIGITVSFVHRSYTFPYVYLDQQVYTQHPARFSLMAALLGTGFVAFSFLWRAKLPAGTLLPIDLAMGGAGLALFAQVWLADRALGAASARVIDPRTRVIVLVPFCAALGFGLSGALTEHGWQGRVAGDSVVLVGFALASAWLALRTPARARLVATVVAALVVFGLASAAAGAPALNESELRAAALLAPVATLAAVWNVWHTLMQKYGILRVYAAKSKAPVEKRAAGWIDRFLIFSWFPLLAFVVGPANRDVVLKQGAVIKQYLAPLLDGLVLLQPYLLVPSIGLVLLAIGLFVRAEIRSGVVSWPRISMAAALTLLHAAFLVANPVKVYIAYGFSHAVEYMVFVWAFQRRRYATELPHKPLLGRILRHPVLWYVPFSVAIAAFYFYVELGDEWMVRPKKLDVFGVPIGTWVFSFAIWHSFAHFWFDGFLWKMKPNVRQSL